MNLIMRLLTKTTICLYIQSSLVFSNCSASPLITQVPKRPDLEQIEHGYLDSMNYDRCSEGLQLIQKILKKHKQDAYAHFMEGLAYHRMAYAHGSRYKTSLKIIPEYQAALQSYNDAWKYGFRTAALYYHRGEAKLNLGMPKAALEDLSESLKLDPSKDWVWSTRGMAYNELGDRRKACSDISKAIQLDPSRSTNYEKLAILEFQLGAPHSARRAMDQALALQPNVVSYRVLRARLALASNDQVTAEKDIAAALAHDPTNAIALKLRGSLNMKQDQPEQAQADLLSAEEIYNSVVHPNQEMGRVSAAVAQDMLAKAVSQYRRMKIIASPQYLYELGLLEWGLGDWTSSCSHLERLLKESQEHDATELHSAALCTLAYESSHRNKDAHNLLEHYEQFVSNKSQISMVISYLSGKTSQSALDQAARDDQERTVINFYVGASLARQGKIEEARKRLRWVKDKGDTRLDQYLLSIMELERLPR